MPSCPSIALTAFLLSFVFGLGGLGSAVALIPVLTFMGVPFPLARSAGLFTNFVATASATLHNLRSGSVDFKVAVPVVIASALVAPFGALTSHYLPERVVGVLFSLFLAFAGFLALTPRKGNGAGEVSALYGTFTGAVAGFLSGLLGIGGGGVISPLLALRGFSPKRVAVVTAFAVPFSSLTAFLSYAKLGSVNWSVTVCAAVPASVSGFLAALVTHRFLQPRQVKKLLGLLFLILAVKFALKFI